MRPQFSPSAADGAVSAPQVMQQAAALYAAGKLDGAEQLCARVLQTNVGHAQALNLLGAIAARTGRTQEAADLLARAAAASPRDPAPHINYGGVLRSLGRSAPALESYQRALQISPSCAEAHLGHGTALEDLARFTEALHSYDQALRIRPDYVEAYNNRGNAFMVLGRAADALDSYEQALRLKPDFALAHCNRGIALQGLGRFAEALDGYARAVAIRPDYTEALLRRSDVLRQLGRLPEAADSYAELLKLNPGSVEAYNNRGNVLSELRRYDEALQSYVRALEIDPDCAEAYYNRGNALAAVRRPAEALDSFSHALRIRPGYVEAYNNRAALLNDLGRCAEALESYQRALKLKPDFVEALNGRGDALRDLGRLEQALESYQQALQRRPDYEWLYGMWLYTKLHLCDWRNVRNEVETLVTRVREGVRATPPFLTLAVTDSLAAQCATARIWADSTPANGVLGPPARRQRDGKIRLGYYSADFHAHATAYLIAELIERHNRNRFEVVAFSFGPDQQDGTRKRLVAGFDRFIDARMKSDREVAQLSRELGIDIAVDLKGHTQNARFGVFSYRAAPIQVSYLGYPGTMGCSYIDYLIADATLIPPESRPYYTEKIVYLPHSYQVNDRQRPIADRLFSREELGLPPKGLVFCSFSSSYKITPEIFDIWMRLLRQVDGSVLWLIEDNAGAPGNLRREADARGVAGQRLVFAPFLPLAEHLARHRCADLFLDTWPCNAHTTASDALWSGLPVLTRMGESFAARVAGSLLNAIGLPELITGTAEQYEALALELATHPERLVPLRERLERNRLTQPLFDTPLYTRHLEDAYRQMYERHHAGSSPLDLRVAP
jgi:predicted O-linked N-acetylglucosamine transferase (SPINDLY family)